jgi:nucleoid-associated protein YgaU
MTDPKDMGAEDKMAEARAKIARNQAMKEAVAEHTVEAGETLSDLALKYYGHATQPYYMHIYEANKDVIGDNPNVIKPGQELVIPKKPDV